mmetsp:Transcript_32164/g.75525  ORF Transcript_32164/g.75525 Transcript_32164/m.75525 type:complete len:591 (+) Transcript_32164:92-1864(+)
MIHRTVAAPMGYPPTRPTSMADRVSGAQPATTGCPAPATMAPPPGQMFSFSAQTLENMRKRMSNKGVEDDLTSVTAPTISTVAPSVTSGAQGSVFSGIGIPRGAPTAGDSGPVRKVTAVQASPQGSCETVAPQPTGDLAFDERIQRLEDKMKGFSQILREAANKEFKSPEDELQHLVTGIAACKEQRGSLQESVVRIAGLLQQEQNTREHWADTYKPNLVGTLNDLSRSIDQSVGESSRVMDRRLDETDAAVQKLRERVTAVFGDKARGIARLAGNHRSGSQPQASPRQPSSGTTAFSRFGRMASQSPEPGRVPSASSTSDAQSGSSSAADVPRSPSGLGLRNWAGPSRASRPGPAMESLSEEYPTEADPAQAAPSASVPAEGAMDDAERISPAAKISARQFLRDGTTREPTGPLAINSPAHSVNSGRSLGSRSALGSGGVGVQASSAQGSTEQAEGLWNKLEALKAEHASLKQANASLSTRVQAAKSVQSTRSPQVSQHGQSQVAAGFAQPRLSASGVNRSVPAESPVLMHGSRRASDIGSNPPGVRRASATTSATAAPDLRIGQPASSPVTASRSVRPSVEGMGRPIS